jgi:hypothetical protein
MSIGIFVFLIIYIIKLWESGRGEGAVTHFFKRLYEKA